MKKLLPLCLILFAWILFSGFSLSPETWIKDIAKSMERTTPKYTSITFWDEEIGEQRGIRSFLYTVLLDPKNKRVDARLHNKMSQLLAYMCSKVITLDSFEDKTQKLAIENVLLEMVHSWQQSGRIDPEQLFTSLPFLDFDILVLMERTHYDQIWKGDEKKLLIGINIAAFEMDFGEPLYMDQVLAEVPWFGMGASYEKAEHAALLKVADAMGKQFQKAADLINAIHKEKTREAEIEKRAQERERARKLKAEEREFVEQTKKLERFLRDHKQPPDIISELTVNLDAMEKSLEKRGDEVTLEELQNRRQLLASMGELLEQHHTWVEEQQELEKLKEIAPPPKENLPSLENPSKPIELPQAPSKTLPQKVVPSKQKGLVPLPSFSGNAGNYFNRQWLVPSKPSEQFTNAPKLNEQTQKTGGNQTFSKENEVEENTLPAPEERPAPIQQQEQQSIIPLDTKELYRIRSKDRIRNTTSAEAEINQAT